MLSRVILLKVDYSVVVILLSYGKDIFSILVR